MTTIPEQIRFDSKPVEESTCTGTHVSWLSEDKRYKVTRIVSGYGDKTPRYAALQKDEKSLATDGYSVVSHDPLLGATHPRYYNNIGQAFAAIEQAASVSIINRDAFQEMPEKEDDMTNTKGKKMRVTRDAAIQLLKGLGFTVDVATYDNKRLQGKLRKLAEMDDLPELEDEDMKSLLEDICTAVDDNEGILVKDSDPEEDEDDAPPRKKGSKEKDEMTTETKKKASKKESTNGHISRTDRWEEVERKDLKVTSKLAAEFRDMKHFPRDRGLTKSRKEFLKGVILKGEFEGNVWASVKVKENGETYRLNGRGTSTAFCELFEDGKEDIEAVVTVKRYACETMEDAAALYATFDPKQSARSKGNLLQAYAAGSEKLIELSNQVVKLAASGLGFSEYEKEYRKRTAEEQGKLMLEHENFVLWLGKILDVKKKEFPHVFRMPVVAAMASTYMTDKKAATEFWEAVRDDSDDPKTDPRRVLRNWLLTHNFGAKSEKAVKEVASDREGYVICLQAWNAWRDKDNKWKPKYNVKSNTPKLV